MGTIGEATHTEYIFLTHWPREDGGRNLPKHNKNSDRARSLKCYNPVHLVTHSSTPVSSTLMKLIWTCVELSPWQKNSQAQNPKGTCNSWAALRTFKTGAITARITSVVGCMQPHVLTWSFIFDAVQTLLVIRFHRGCSSNYPPPAIPPHPPPRPPPHPPPHQPSIMLSSDEKFSPLQV